MLKVCKEQAEFLSADENFICMIGGRQSGKTWSIVLRMLRECINHPGFRILYTTCDETQARDVYDRLLAHPALKPNLQHYRETPQKTIVFRNKSSILVRVTAFPDQLKGPTYNMVVCDEIQDSWQYDDFSRVVPALVLVRGGTIVLSGQPRSKHHWVYPFYLNGLPKRIDPYSGGMGKGLPDYKTIVLPTPNGLLFQGAFGQKNLDRVKEATLVTPNGDFIWKRDYLCEWSEDATLKAFRESDVEALKGGQPHFQPQTGWTYGVANDLGWSHDYGAVIVMAFKFDRDGDPTHYHVAWAERMPLGMRHGDQRHKIKDIVERYRNCAYCLDATGNGNPGQRDGFVELYYEVLPNLHRVFLTASKAELVTDLKLLIEQNKRGGPKITIPEEFTEVFAELAAYERVQKADRISYGSPKGSLQHDDYVCAMIMAVNMAKKKWLNNDSMSAISRMVG
jgi:hypothetical protein